jgi:acetylornithine deacetylase
MEDYSKVLDFIDEDELVDLAKKMVSFESYPPDETPLAEYLEGYLKGHGFEVEMLEVEPSRMQPMATLKGSGEGFSLTFNGHMDIDPMTLEDLETWEKVGKKPFEPTVEEGRFYGQGVGNMKGGVAAMIIAGIALKRSGIPIKGDLILAPVVGELQGGVGTDFMVKKGLITDYALVPEPSNLTIRTFTAGVIRLLINTIGKSVWVGATHVIKPVHALEKMCKVVKALKNIEFTFEPKEGVPDLPRMQVGSVVGGVTRDYTIWRASYSPDFCSIVCDIRTVPGMTAESVVNDIRKVIDPIKDEDPEFEYEIQLPPATYEDPWRTTKLVRPPCDTSVDSWIVDLVKKNHEEITEKTPLIGAGYALGSHAGNDAGYLFEAGVEAITYGPRNKGIRGEPDMMGVYMLVDDMMTVAKVYALTAAEICTKTKE